MKEDYPKSTDVTNFWVIWKITSGNTHKTTHDNVNYSAIIFALLNLERGVEGGELKIWISQEPKELYQ